MNDLSDLLWVDAILSAKRHKKDVIVA